MVDLAQIPPPNSPQIGVYRIVTQFTRGATAYSECLSSVNQFTRWRQGGGDLRRLPACSALSVVRARLARPVLLQ